MPPGSKAPALFNRHECALIAIFVTVLCWMTLELVTNFRLPRFIDDVVSDGEVSIFEQAIVFFQKWVWLRRDFVDLVSILSLVILPVVVFVTARREPRRILVGLLLLIAMYLLSLVCFTPPWIAGWLRQFSALMAEPMTMYYQGGFATDLAPYAFFLLLVCSIGEFSHLVTERELRDSCHGAQADGIDAEERAARRERLILAVLGRPMPVPLALGRCFALLVIPAFAVMSLGELQIRMHWYETELSAPSSISVVSQNPALRPRGIPEAVGKIVRAGKLVDASQLDRETAALLHYVAVKVSNEGQVFVNGDPFDTPISKDLPGFESRLKGVAFVAGAQWFIALQMDSGVRHERLVDVLCVTARLGKPVIFAD